MSTILTTSATPYTLNDRTLRLVGIPLVSFILPATLHFDDFRQVNATAGMYLVMSLCTTVALWEGNRYIMVRMRRLLPGYSQTTRKKYETLKQDFSPPAYAKKMESLLDSLDMSCRSHKTRFLVKNGEQLIPIGQEQIAYFYTANELACLVRRDGRQYLVDYTLEELEDRIDPLQFFRLNRQFIAQVSAIQKIHAYFNGKLKVDLCPETSQEVLVSREKATAFKAWLDG